MVGAWARARGDDIQRTRLYEGDVLPAMDSFDRLLVLGGPMSVHDQARYPWLDAERRFIEDAMTAGKRVVGICLGAQLLAQVLGATVRPQGYREIGWFPLYPRPGLTGSPLADLPMADHPALHWHGDTFALPAGARHLLASEACEHQAFLTDDGHLGLQCHLEWTPATARQLVVQAAAELDGSRWVQPREQIVSAQAPFASANALLFSILDRIWA